MAAIKVQRGSTGWNDRQENKIKERCTERALEGQTGVTVNQWLNNDLCLREEGFHITGE